MWDCLHKANVTYFYKDICKILSCFFILKIIVVNNFFILTKFKNPKSAIACNETNVICTSKMF